MIWIAITFGIAIILTYGLAYYFSKTDERGREVVFAAVVHKTTGKVIKKIDVTDLPSIELHRIYRSLQRNVRVGEEVRIITEFR
jgi:hypothetical protein